MTRPDEGRAQFIGPLDLFVLVDFGVCVSCVKLNIGHIRQESVVFILLFRNLSPGLTKNPSRLWGM